MGGVWGKHCDYVRQDAAVGNTDYMLDHNVDLTVKVNQTNVITQLTSVPG